MPLRGENGRRSLGGGDGEIDAALSRFGAVAALVSGVDSICRHVASPEHRTIVTSLPHEGAPRADPGSCAAPIPGPGSSRSPPDRPRSPPQRARDRSLRATRTPRGKVRSSPSGDGSGDAAGTATRGSGRLRSVGGPYDAVARRVPSPAVGGHTLGMRRAQHDRVNRGPSDLPVESMRRQFSLSLNTAGVLRVGPDHPAP
jgi:hypothetical protein